MAKGDDTGSKIFQSMSGLGGVGGGGIGSFLQPQQQQTPVQKDINDVASHGVGPSSDILKRVMMGISGIGMQAPNPILMQMIMRGQNMGQGLGPSRPMQQMGNVPGRDYVT